MTTPTEREALIARLRELVPYMPSGGTLVMQAADMLAADAQEIAALRSQALIDGIAYSMRVSERDKARSDYEAREEEAHQLSEQTIKLQAELDGIRKQQPVTFLQERAHLEQEWCGLRALKHAEAQQVAVPHSGSDETPPVFARRWNIAADGFGLQQADDGVYVYFDDAMSVLHASLAAAPQPPQREPMTEAEIRSWWESENGLEDCDMCKLADFEKVIRAIEDRCGIRSKP